MDDYEKLEDALRKIGYPEELLGAAVFTYEQISSVKRDFEKALTPLVEHAPDVEPLRIILIIRELRDLAHRLSGDLNAMANSLLLCAIESSADSPSGLPSDHRRA